jgi:NADPH2:quinone reductase
VVVGSRGPVAVNPRDLMSREAQVYGVMETFNSAAERAEIHGLLYQELTNGRLKPVIGREFPLHEAAAAHRAVMEPGAYGKIVLTP